MPRRTFTRADAVLHARTLDEVRPVLQEAERYSKAGKTVIGFVGYEAAPAFDAAMKVHGAVTPLAWFGVLTAPEDAEGHVTVLPPIQWKAQSSQAGVVAAVERIREEIAAGTTYQVNYTTRLRADFNGDALALYEQLHAAQGAGYHALIETDEFAVVSASPELFFTIEGDRIITRPMKGTRPRGRWIEEDEALARELADSAKDQAENLMIVDLLRNDLGRIARYGTVNPVSLFDVEQFRTVHQMTSTIEAQLNEGTTVCNVFDALFPCGSVTGAPKISTMELIAELEDSPRGVYCGAIGVMDAERTVFNVAIRTAFIHNDRAEYGTGAGITFDSDPDAEYDEMLAKSRVLTEHWPAFQLLETMRAEDGHVVRLEAHLQRMRESARYFGYEFDEDAVMKALASLPREGNLRVRLLLDDEGRPRAEWQPLDVVENPTYGIARTSVDSGNRFLYHKTTFRGMYEDALANDLACWDVLLHNERGEATEFTRGNLVVEIDGGLFTPALECGILRGVFRAELVRSGRVVERILSLDEVTNAQRVWLVNSLREWLELRLCENST